MHDVHDAKEGRKKGLPSVTTILGVLDKPGLTYWKQEQCILTASQNKREDGEDDKTYSKRIMSIFSKSQFAASTGTMLHDFCEKRASPVPLGFEAVCKLIRDYQQENFGRTIAEESFAYQDFRYGGRIDVYGLLKDGSRFIGDWKSQRPKEGKFTVYDEWISQLSAYSKADTSVRHISIMISSDPLVPMLEVHEWSKEEIEQGYEVFNACKKIWEIKNG